MIKKNYNNIIMTVRPSVPPVVVFFFSFIFSDFFRLNMNHFFHIYIKKREGGESNEEEGHKHGMYHNYFHVVIFVVFVCFQGIHYTGSA